MAAKAIIWVFTTCLMTITTSGLVHRYNSNDYLQHYNNTPILRQFNTSILPNQGICIGNVALKPFSLYSPMRNKTLEKVFNNFKDAYINCVVIVGNLELSVMETATSEDYDNFRFPNLREVTGFVLVYRVPELVSLSQLFPNLARIRGRELHHNYALIIHDMSGLKEIGLFGLMKIDRGGAIVYAVPKVCYADTVDWNTIAPRSRHVIYQQSFLAECRLPCSCTLDSTYNHCWNNKKCQIYTEGPEANKCHEQCFGCRNTVSTHCNLCRYFTYNGVCVSKCPPDTIILPDCQYCITVDVCRNLSGFAWNNTCVFDCPVDYVHENGTRGPTCRHCVECTKTCKDLIIQSVSSIQAAGHCVFVDGSLTIHVRAVKEAMEELREYLSRIQEVSDYIHIHGSLTISSLDFLSSLRRIRGQKLFKGMYSLVIYNMNNLQALFTEIVTETIEIENGAVQMLDNPMLCMSEIKKILPKFPVKHAVDINLPPGKNGYSAGCKETPVGLQIRSVNQTSALIIFSAENLNKHYSVLYVRLPPGAQKTIVPETCSEYEWNAIDAELSYGHVIAIAQLTSLRPASTYAVCVESFNPDDNTLARSIINYFTTSAGIPEPPFINELSAKNSGTVVIRWVDHLDYRYHLIRYELDVSLIPIFEKDILVKDQCKYAEDYEVDKSLHAVVMRPPVEYAPGCESMCGVLSTVTEGAMVEEFFDVCAHIDCYNMYETQVSVNTSFGSYVNTLVLNLDAPRNEFQIGGLAPFRDYRFRLRACTEFTCSRTARSVVRTYPMEKADIPIITYIHVDDFSHMTVKWKPPTYINGAILSYIVEVFATNISDPSLIDPHPQWWCVLANQTYSIVNPVESQKYYVRVCSRSMATDKTCSELNDVVKYTPTWWSVGVIFGVLLYTLSLCIGYLIMKCRASDRVPIVDITSTFTNESAPPAKMISDFVFTVPLRESKLN